MRNKKMSVTQGDVIKEYIVTLYTASQIGVWTRIIMIISRRRISVKSMCASASGDNSRSQFTLVITEASETVIQLCRQFEKQVEIQEVSYCTANEDT